MPLFKKKSAKKEEKKDQKADSKSDLAMAYALQKRKKTPGRNSDAGSALEPHSKPTYKNIDENYSAKYNGPKNAEIYHRGDYLDVVHPSDVSRRVKTHKEEGYSQGGEVHCHDGSCYADGGMVCGQPYSIPEALRCKFMAAGGRVEDDTEAPYGEAFDIQNEAMAGGDIYDGNDIEPQPEDSNEEGDEREKKRANAHGKSIFSKIKLKKAQPGDRGKY